jgi:hypothetical protein
MKIVIGFAILLFAATFIGTVQALWGGYHRRNKKSKHEEWMDDDGK